jgi:hypothetical protein
MPQNVNKKIIFFKHQRIGNHNIRSTVLDLGTRRTLGVSITPRPMYPRGKSQRCVPQSRFGLCEEEKDLCLLPGIEPRLLYHPISNLVAIPTEQHRVSNCDIIYCDV